MKKPREIYSSNDCDNGDRLADLLGIGDEWLTFDQLCEKASDRIEELQAIIDAKSTKSIMQKWW